MGDNNDAGGGAPGVPFPRYNAKYNVESWFMKVDAWFDFHGMSIRKEREKYTAIIAHGDDEILSQVYDLVRTIPAEHPYTTIKTAIIERFSESSMARLEKLSTGIQLGDLKPSHLLTQLQRTEATTVESIVRRY